MIHRFSARELDSLGRSFRNAFFAKVTTDFDDILRAIDRAHLASLGALGRLPPPVRMLPPDWLIAPVFRIPGGHH